jgi:hypothetical protein
VLGDVEALFWALNKILLHMTVRPDSQGVFFRLNTVSLLDEKFRPGGIKAQQITEKYNIRFGN